MPFMSASVGTSMVARLAIFFNCAGHEKTHLAIFSNCHCIINFSLNIFYFWTVFMPLIVAVTPWDFNRLLLGSV